MKKCRNCGEEYKPSNSTQNVGFCSRKCGAEYRYRQFDEYRNKKWLYKKYIEEELTSSDIAKIVGCGRHIIIKWLKKFGIKIRGISETRKSKGYLKKMSGESHPRYKKMGTYTTAKRRSYGNKFACVVCGWDEATRDIHHKEKEKGDGFENLTILCPNHHRMAHRGLLETKDLPSLEEIVMENQS